LLRELNWRGRVALLAARGFPGWVRVALRRVFFLGGGGFVGGGNFLPSAAAASSSAAAFFSAAAAALSSSAASTAESAPEASAVDGFSWANSAGAIAFCTGSLDKTPRPAMTKPATTKRPRSAMAFAFAEL
jgi:hypothetical protein